MHNELCVSMHIKALHRIFLHSPGGLTKTCQEAIQNGFNRLKIMMCYIPLGSKLTPGPVSKATPHDTFESVVRRFPWNHVWSISNRDDVAWYSAGLAYRYRPILNIGRYMPISAKPIYRYRLTKVCRYIGRYVISVKCFISGLGRSVTKLPYIPKY